MSFGATNIKIPAVVKTVVTSELGAGIARKHGIVAFDTLIGFKFIGEKITQFEKAKKKTDTECDTTSSSVTKNPMLILLAYTPGIKMQW